MSGVLASTDIRIISGMRRQPTDLRARPGHLILKDLRRPVADMSV